MQLRYLSDDSSMAIGPLASGSGLASGRDCEQAECDEPVAARGLLREFHADVIFELGLAYRKDCGEGGEGRRGFDSKSPTRPPYQVVLTFAYCKT